MNFDDQTIQALFGSEAAEDEDPERLKQYFFKSEVYRSIRAQLPLRIVVGHKGIGKSAMIAIAIQEDLEDGILPVLIKPNDIAELQFESDNFIKLISHWKTGLIEIVARKALQSLGQQSDSPLEKLKAYGGKTVQFLIDSVKPLRERVDLTPTQKMLIENLIKSNFINVYLDDLDRGWEGKKSDITRISALLNAVRDISNENRSIRFKVALRSDVYFLVRTSDESTDKIEGAVTWHSWTNHEILALLVKRIETYFGRDTSEDELTALPQAQLAQKLSDIMVPVFNGKGKWSNIPVHRMLMSLIRKRPRDLVKLCTLAAKQAQRRKGQLVESMDFQSVFEEYSQGRVQDTINEYRSELPDIERLVMGMKPVRKRHEAALSYTYSTDQLIKKLKNITEQGQFRFRNNSIATEKQLAQFLYKINFLTARKELSGGFVQRRYFEENRYLSSEFADFGYGWEVHPAYRWALQPSDLTSIFEELSISEE